MTTPQDETSASKTSGSIEETPSADTASSTASASPGQATPPKDPSTSEGGEEDDDEENEEEEEEELTDAERAAPPMGPQKYMLPEGNTLICVYTKSGLRYGCGSALPLLQEAKVHESNRLSLNVLYMKHFRGNDYLKDGYVVLYCSPQQDVKISKCAAIILRDVDIELMVYEVTADDLLNHISTIDKAFVDNLIEMARVANEEAKKAEAAKAQAKKKLPGREGEGPVTMSLRRLSEKKRANRDGSSFFTIRVRVDAETKRILEYHNKADKDLNPGKVIMTAVKQVFGPSVPPDRPPPEPKAEMESLELLIAAGSRSLRDRAG